MGKRLIDTNYHDFAPRIGIAWSPSDKWSFRAGFGRFFSMESKNSIFDMSRGMGGRTGNVAPNHLRDTDVQLHEFPRHGLAPGDPARRPHLGCEPASAGQQHHVIRAERPAHARQGDESWRWATPARCTATCNT